MNRALTRWGLGGLAILSSIVVFLVPFAFIVTTAVMDSRQAGEFTLAWPRQFQFVENLTTVLQTRDYLLVIAFINSTVLTVVSVTALVILGAMVAFVLQRRKSRLTGLANFLVLTGLIMPPAVVPTIWVMQKLGLFGGMPGLILIEITYGLSFTVLLFRAFLATVPRELDEAAIIDGAGPLRLFFRVVLPLLRPVTVTIIVVQSVNIFNDFTNPLYFAPGDQNATVQLTLFNFQSQNLTSYNLLFMDILLITIPPLIMYLLFNRQIVAGMTSGAVKG
ncbi:carbohydrate ABC transporter permease [Actinoplanes sp. LDG1-06]|uniref:Carbohydrate ABC transporter permease n=1 Tax=Paractinoplanes ovalisporus TaxID=2810368 RepID=A0ABS2AFI3_9ACTN|nr:carbohydrate ABC transporter permease [Actinoplanes ovalisporus]MBM2618587.1 carbohydrate ABC transporter permease [Actinoplanes ovalisporus]